MLSSTNKRTTHSVAATSALLTIGFLIGVSRTPAAELTAETLLAPDRVIEVEISLPKADWDKLRKQMRDFRSAFTGLAASDPYTYFKADVTIEGVKIAGVGVRKKGFFGSADNDFPSLKIKFDEYTEQAPVDGIEVLTLNNNKQDPSLVSQLLAYRLFNAAGVQAPKSNFAKVTVNGEDLGIYSNVESIGKPFLKRRYGDDTGKLYEGTLADFYPKAVDRIEAKDEAAEDRTKLMQLAKLLADEKAPPLAEIEKIVDLGNFLPFWAMESLIGFWDGYSNNQNNYWVYENPANGKLYFTPWGADATLSSPQGPFGFNRTGPTSIYAEGMLANRLYHAPGVAERYRKAMRAILKNVWKEDELISAIDGAEKLLADDLHERQTGAPQAMESMREFIRKRRAAIEKELAKWPVKVAAKPRKPSYIVDVGTAKGIFAGAWSEEPAAKPLEAGKATIELTLNGEAVEFKQLGAMAHMMQPFGFGFGPGGGGPGGGRGRGGFEPPPPPAMIVFTGRKKSDGGLVTLTLSLDREAFAAGAGKTIAAQGSLSQGEPQANPFMPFGGQILDGELKLAKAGVKDGDAVEGEFTLRVVESRGGFMDRRPR